MQAAKDVQKVLEVPLGQIAEEQEEEESSFPSNTDYPLFSIQFLRRHGHDLFTCAAAWFLVDVVFYSSYLFQSQIYGYHLPPKDELHAFQEAFRVARLQAIMTICSSIPGYFATVFFIDRIGRVKIQAMGFLFMALGMFAIGFPYNYWVDKDNIGFMILYGLTFFFSNFGPNTTTFIVPAELFPARFRCTCHGISGAAGKIGAIIGSVGFLWVLSSGKLENGHNSKGNRMTALLVMLGIVCIMGMIVTCLFTRETKGRSLEENENEDEASRVCFSGCVSYPCIPRAQASANQVVNA